MLRLTDRVIHSLVHIYYVQKTLPHQLLSDSKVLNEIFIEADGILNAGELNYRDFSYPLVRKIVFLQREFSLPDAEDRYGKEQLNHFPPLARQFLGQLKDRTLTPRASTEVRKQLDSLFPSLNVPR